MTDAKPNASARREPIVQFLLHCLRDLDANLEGRDPSAYDMWDRSRVDARRDVLSDLARVGVLN